MKKLLTSFLGCCILSSILYSQSENIFFEEKKPIHSCDVHEHQQRKFIQNEELRTKNESIEQFYRETMHRLQQNIDLTGVRSGTVYSIPVVVHVMHLPGTEIGDDENISMAQIEQGISDLNDGFRNSGAYNLAIDNSDADDDGVISADVEIEFCLASTDPSGNPTNGVNRISTTLSNLYRDDPSATTTCLNGGVGEQEGDMKELSYWDANDYMNIWLVKEICKLSSGGTGSSNCGVAGYAYYASAHGACFDGIVNEASYFGTTTGNSTVHIHEAGHYFNVRHTFNDPDAGGPKTPCNNSDCLTEGDFVCDTPPDNSTSSVNCTISGVANTCSTDTDDPSANNPFTANRQDLYENYMDYGFGVCQHVFTEGQKDRMRTALTGTRASLLTSSGCDIAAANVAYFYDGGTSTAEASSTTSGTCRDYYDIDIEVRLYKAAASSTSVTFSVDASSTASDMADLELMASSVTFGIGESSKNLPIRIYNDAAIESQEIGIINITSVTGSASAATFNQTHRISIDDDDNAPSGDRPIVFSDDFESGNSGWTNSWFGGSTTNWWEFGTNGCGSFGGSAYISNDNGASNNYSAVSSNSIIYRAIDASGFSDLEMRFDYAAGGDGSGDRGQYIRRATAGSGPFITSGNYNGSDCSSTTSDVVNLSALGFDNSSFDIGFLWYSDGSSVENPGLTIDNVEITAAATDVETTSAASATEYLGPNSDVYFISGDGALIGRIRNLSNHDYGCTTISIPTGGISSFTGGAGTVFETYHFTDKELSISPTINNPTGSYEVTLYYSEAEISGWESASGESRNDLFMVKSSNSLSTADAMDSELEAPMTSVFTAGANYAYTATFYTGFSNFGLTNAPPAALPIELTDFHGRKESNTTHLYWTTETEINNDYFIIEKSADGISYQEIGRVDGAGNSTEILNYDFVDEQPYIGNNYYRLIQVDMDGSIDIFGPIQVSFNKSGYANIFPVPTKSGTLQLTYDSEFSDNLSWEIIDIQGKVKEQGVLEIEVGMNQFSFKDSNLNDGVYFIRLTQGNLIQSKRFIILN